MEIGLWNPPHLLNYPRTSLHWSKGEPEETEYKGNDLMSVNLVLGTEDVVDRAWKHTGKGKHYKERGVSLFYRFALGCSRDFQKNSSGSHWNHFSGSNKYLGLFFFSFFPHFLTPLPCYKTKELTFFPGLFQTTNTYITSKVFSIIHNRKWS